MITNNELFKTPSHTFDSFFYIFLALIRLKTCINTNILKKRV